MRTELITLHEDRKVTLTAYIQEVGGEFANISKRPAVLILPGGGYSMCSDREADPVVFPYLKAGYQAFILRYSVGKDSVWPNPLNDYEEAISMIREKTDEWHVLADKIVVIGFSAGGHLAACAATMSVNRPNAAILGYPVIEGECAKLYQETAPDVIGEVDRNTCPCFIFATRTDSIVPVKNSVHFMDALIGQDISFESHIYSNGPHGFSTCDSSVQTELGQLCNRVPNWVVDSIEWLKDMLGDFGDGQMTSPRFGAKLNGNYDPYLNIDCTIGYLLSKPEAAALLGSMGQRTVQATEEDKEQWGQMQGQMNQAAIQSTIMNMKLRQMLGFVKLSEERIKEIDEMLGRIENK